MDREQQRDWRDLERRAVQELREGARARPRTEVARVVQLLVLPTFSNRSSYEVFRVDPVGESEFLVVRSTWDSEADSAKLATPVERLRHPRALEPTVTRRSGAPSSESALALADELDGLTVRVMPASHSIGLDGTAYELTIGSSFAGASFRWWECPPSRWERLGAIAERVVDVVEGCLDG